MDWKGPAAALAAAVLLGAQTRVPYSTWSDYGGSSDSMQYSALKQIDQGNVAKLELAWSHQAPGPGAALLVQPAGR